MIVGQINLSGVRDKEMVVIVQAQAASGGTLTISQLQPAQAPGNPPTQVFNNLIIAWNTEAGFRNLATMLQSLVDLKP